MLSNKKEVAIAIMNLLATQAFDEWYNGRFNDWIEGADDAPAMRPIPKRLKISA